MTPFLKWAGGKRWLVDSKKLCIPQNITTYLEPFLGGGAVFFAFLPHNSVLSDLNGRLVETYQAIKLNYRKVEALLSHHAENHSDEYYYKIRGQYFQTIEERAAHFIYLNRTCFNGIYRENLSGNFNVPRGTKNTVTFKNDDFAGWSAALQNAKICTTDFEKTINTAMQGDFMFVDPPYTVLHNKNGFVKYNQKIFNWDDQIRLSILLKKAADRGVNFILTNADHDSIKELYRDFLVCKSISRHSVIAASSKKRSKTTELLVSTYHLK